MISTASATQDTIPATICEGRKQKENRGQNLFWIFVTGAAVYLFDTLCPGYWGDDLSCDRQYLGTRSQRAESGECQPHTSDCELISPDGDYVASKQWAPSYEAIGLTGDTLINTRLGK